MSLIHTFLSSFMAISIPPLQKIIILFNNNNYKIRPVSASVLQGGGGIFFVSPGIIVIDVS